MHFSNPFVVVENRFRNSAGVHFILALLYTTVRHPSKRSVFDYMCWELYLQHIATDVWTTFDIHDWACNKLKSKKQRLNCVLASSGLENVSIDILVLLPTAGYKFVMFIRDPYSKWAKAVQNSKTRATRGSRPSFTIIETWHLEYFSAC